ncbi:MAG: adenylate/guanylate cyclase domain-containing protein [Alphaproteobacteria bacterium]
MTDFGRRRRGQLPLVEAAILIALAVALLVIVAQRIFPFWRHAENVVEDTRVVTLGPAAGASRIVLVTITEDTLATLPFRSPVDRRFLARLVEELDRAGVEVLGIDILFDRPTEREGDVALIAALRAFGRPVVLAAADGRHGLDPAQQQYLESFIAAAGARKGLSVLETDSDGVVRRLPEAGPDETRHFAAALADASHIDVLSAERIAYLRPPSGSTDVFPAIPAEVALSLAASRPEFLATVVKGKIVLVGADLPHDDRHRTPLGITGEQPNGLAGVAIHAQALHQLLDGRRIRESAWWSDLALAFVAAAWGAGAATIALATWARIGALLAGLALVWAGGFAVFLWSSLLLPLVGPTVALGLGYGAASAYAYRREHRARAFIRRAFARFVSPAVVEALTREPGRLVLGGERRELTFLVSDVAGFTAHVERLPPAELVSLMNGYFDGLSRIILAQGGTIAKFVGDGVFAFFGAPLEQPDHAARAMAAALAIDRFAETFRRSHEGFGATRVGVHTGVAVVGNFGGSERFDYTALGDPANTAARLESSNKYTGVRIAVSAATARAVPGVVFRPIGALVLKGKSEALEAFEPVSDGLSPSALERYRIAYDRLAGGDEGAAEAFRDLAASDPLAAFHLARLSRGERGVRIAFEAK